MPTELRGFLGLAGYSTSSKVFVIGQIMSQFSCIEQGYYPSFSLSSVVISFHHHSKHHDSHSEGIPWKFEASDGEGSKISKEFRRKTKRVEQYQEWYDYCVLHHLRYHLNSIPPCQLSLHQEKSSASGRRGSVRAQQTLRMLRTQTGKVFCVRTTHVSAQVTPNDTRHAICLPDTK